VAGPPLRGCTSVHGSELEAAPDLNRDEGLQSMPEHPEAHARQRGHLVKHSVLRGHCAPSRPEWFSALFRGKNGNAW